MPSRRAHFWDLSDRGSYAGRSNPPLANRVCHVSGLEHMLHRVQSPSKKGMEDGASSSQNRHQYTHTHTHTHTHLYSISSANLGRAGGRLKAITARRSSSEVRRTAVPSEQVTESKVECAPNQSLVSSPAQPKPSTTDRSVPHHPEPCDGVFPDEKQELTVNFTLTCTRKASRKSFILVYTCSSEGKAGVKIMQL